MRICFIQPPWLDIHGKYEELAEMQGNDPPLGVCYLAAIAESLGHECRIIDAGAERLGLKEQVKAVAEFKPDLIGITSSTPTFHKAVAFAKAYKKKHKTPILIGGPHITVLRKKAFESCFDYGFVGECEFEFKKFIEEYAGAKDWPKVNNLLYRSKGKVISNPLADYIPDLDKLPFPARHLLNNDLYFLILPKRGKTKHTSIMTMRGCPFRCVFCSQHTMFGYKARVRSAKNVADEMQDVVERLGIRHFVFVDSTLTLFRKFIVELCKEIIKRKLNITWEGWTRANLIDKQLLKLMKKAGFIRISFGIESGDPKILKLIKKEVSLDDVRKAYKMVADVGIEATCSVMIGHPGETRESIMKTINFVRSIPEVKYSPLSIATPYPGTELLEMAQKGKHGLRLHEKDFSKFTRYGGAVMSVNDLSREDLIKLQRKGMLRIHLTPGRIIYHLRRTSFKDAVKNAKAFLRSMF